MGINKPLVKLSEEPLRYICNEAFFAVRGLFPEKWSNGAIAFTEGLIGGYFLADLSAGLYGEAAIMPDINPSTYEREKELEGIVEGSLIILGIGTMISPKQRRNFFEQYPTYSRGATGVMVGASLRGLQELIF